MSRAEIRPSAHCSSLVFAVLGLAADPDALDLLGEVLLHFSPASSGHESPTALACRAAVEKLGAAHQLSPYLAALYSGLLVQAPHGRGCSCASSC